eukprot:scaffold1091_cov164-Ochromonas_danica.AAC.82
MPKMPPRILPSIGSPGGSRSKALETAVSEFEGSSKKESTYQEYAEDNAAGLPKTNPLNPLQAESVIAVGLMRIADRIARKVLPWQAVLCPRAVESLQELRLSFMQTKHISFMLSMRSKLEEKVNSFLQKKETEVDQWIEKEVSDWQVFLSADEADLSGFLQQDLQRITQRAIAQDNAYRQRELQMANELDDHERDQTREMLTNFRRIVRASRTGSTLTPEMSQKAGKTATGTFELSAVSLFEEKPEAVEVRVLQDSIAKAQKSTTRKLKDMVRSNIRKHEECHDWLCSLADNAITASIAEEVLHKLYGELDFERQKSLDALHSAMLTYQDQHNAILEAIVVFAGRIHQHASDYLQREQLVNRAFANYLIGIITGEIKSNTQEQKKSSYAWETKSILDRGMRKEQMLVNDFNQHISPLDRMVQEFKEKMKIQLDHITMKLQAVINGKENDVNARKALIHKKLARHVNKACNARRQRLKDATAVRRDEFELEALAIAKVDDLTGDLRAAIDSVWVKEHLRERRIFEASLGRLERLEKTALIIWNKHAHLSLEVKEDYEDWLSTYQQDRDQKINHRREIFDRDYFDWRRVFGQQFTGLAKHMRQSFSYIIPHCYTYDIQPPLEQNILDVERVFEIHRLEMVEDFFRLESMVEDFLALQMQQLEQFNQDMRAGLLQEWKENLIRLDEGVNRRIGGLKDMEADLEETIRLTILQHEVEVNVFEQLSCSRLESFWIDWQQKMNGLAKDLIKSNEEYEIAKLGGKARARASQKDRQLDDMINVAKEPGTLTGSAKKGTLTPSARNNGPDLTGTPGATGEVAEEIEETTASANSDPIGAYQLKELLIDTKRMKIILEDIKADIYRDFNHKLTRGLERVRRDLGEGRQRLVPPYAATKILMKCCHTFYDQAKLSERCIGRISSRGVLLFSEGLPMHAQATFAIASTLSLLCQLKLKDEKFDCDDIFQRVEDIKIYFMVGLLAVIHSSFNEYGSYAIQGEILWMCSVLDILPPADLLYHMDCKGLKEEIPKDIVLTGIFSDDPVDLINSLFDLPTDLNTVQKLSQAYSMQLEEQERLSVYAQGNDPPSLGMSNQNLSEDVNLHQAYNKTAQNHVMSLLQHKLPTHTVLTKLKPLLPSHDILILAALLGRPDGSIDLSTHRVCQATSLWRKVSYSLLLLTLTAPGSDYPRLSELIQKHHITNLGNKRMGYGNINCMSPFQSISINIDYLTSIHGAPLSILQAMSLLSKSGNVDVWMEDPKQSRRSDRLVQEIRELIDLYNYHIPRSMKHDDYLQVVLPKNIQEILGEFDLNQSNVVPLELIRSYLTKDDNELNNNQISMVFWSLCRINEDYDENNPNMVYENDSQELVNTLNNPRDQAMQSLTTGTRQMEEGEGGVQTNGSVVTFQTGATHRFRIQTPFHGNTNTYITAFFQDLNAYLHSMPFIDSNVIVGYLANALVPAAAYELVSDAMKLDLSAHNPMPTSAILYIGQRLLSTPEILQNLILKGMVSRNKNFLVGITPYAFANIFTNNTIALPTNNSMGKVQELDEDLASQSQQGIEAGVDSVNTVNFPPYQQLIANFISKLRVYIEVDLLTKYRELVEIKASDRHYGPAGNEPMSFVVPAKRSAGTQKENFYWQELLFRRLNRLNQLVTNWRDVMLDEWGNSLYTSRKIRYKKRIDLVMKSIAVYHRQYDTLRDIIFQQRSNLIAIYNTLYRDLNTSIQDITSLALYHVNFIQRTLRRFQGEYERIQIILKQCLVDYVRHVSTIKRRAINRVQLAFVKLKNDLETSCNGLILGYAAGYAQQYFNNLMANTETWKSKLMDLQGTLIVSKEKFMYSKENIDRDLTMQIMDKLTANRMEFKEFLTDYTILSNKVLAELNTIHNNYILYQKDGNGRLILKIEKAMRECRKIRNAAEQEPLLEAEAMRDMRAILNNTKMFCCQIVEEIKANCIKQLQTFQPIRSAHRMSLEKKKDKLAAKWQEVKGIIVVLIEDYEKEMQKVLSTLHVQALHHINMYLHEQQLSIKTIYAKERALLILAFRKHFREYDLCEAAIFERFNREIQAIVEEVVMLFGPARPPFITKTLKEYHTIMVDSYDSSFDDIVRHQSFLNNQRDDGFTLQRLEFADVFSFNLMKVYKVLQSLEKQFAKEKQEQIAHVEDLSMTRNGDMVRPQVKAVLDLLISGIEIDNDFHKGYNDLHNATQVKANDSTSELSAFLNRYNSIEEEVSIPHTVTLYHQRVNERDYEVTTLSEAALSHIVADHSKLDVIYNSYLHDLDEWSTLTLQLIENAFHNAEKTYLSHLWPSPTSSPRANELPTTEQDLQEMDDKYINKYREMLDNINQSGRLQNSLAESNSMVLSNSSAEGGSGVVPSWMQQLLPSGSINGSVSSPLMQRSDRFGDSTTTPMASSTSAMTTYKGDTKALLDQLTLSAEEEAEHLQRKAAKREVKEAKRRAEREEEEARQRARQRGIQLPRGRGLPGLKTEELQQGWFACTAPEGYIYYHNPETGESLWELPAALRIPKHSANEGSEGGAAGGSSSVALETPRDLLMTDTVAALYVPETVPIRVVDSSYQVIVKKDPKVTMAEVAEEARAVSALVVDTALDVTRVLRGKFFYQQQLALPSQNKEAQIALLLGDRYNPEKLQRFLREDEEDDDEERVKKERTEDPTATELLLPDEEIGDTVAAGGGHVIDNDDHTEVDSELKGILLDLGFGGAGAEERRAEVVPPASTANEITQPENWLALGLGSEAGGGVSGAMAHDDESSDGGEGHGHSLSVYSKQLRYYQETKELELMAKAEEESIAYENEIENMLCNNLLLHLQDIVVNKQRAYPADKKALEEMSEKIKPVNVITIFHDLHTTWQDIDDLIVQTQIQEENEKKLVDQMNQLQDRQRQEKIIEHAEDIDEMAAFLHDRSHLSKITSKRIAIVLILNNILTPKKLAKLWTRKDFDLDQLNLDADDREELENALTQLLAVNNNSSVLDLSHFNSLSYQSPGQPVQHHNTMVMSAGAQGRLNSGNFDSLFADLPLVETDYDVSHPASRQRAQSTHSLHSSYSASPHDYTLTRDGFKSFSGGWIEGLSEKNEVYFYNFRTGESAWNLPALLEGEQSREEQEHETYYGNPLPPPQNHLEENTSSFQSIAQHDESYYYPEQQQQGYDGSYYNDPATGVHTVFYEGSQAIPPHTASYYASPTAPQAEGYNDYGGDQYNQGYEGYDQQYPDGQYGYNANDALQAAASPYEQVQDPNYSYEEGYYDPNYDYNNANYDSNGYAPYGQEQQEQPYYDEQQQQYAYPTEDTSPPYLTDGSWNISDALGVDEYQPRHKPRAIPTYSVPEAQRYAKEQGLSHQVTLLNSQDNWQHELVHTQHTITSQKSLYMNKRSDIFAKLSERVDSKLESFVNDIKAMQKIVKKDLGEANATERDLRRLFEEDINNGNNLHMSSYNLGLRAEKLSFILESLEKFKASVGEKYDAAYKQIEKFTGDWELIKAELQQVGDIFDEGMTNNLQQCRMACEHAIKVFAYDQLKQVAHIKADDLGLLRKDLRKHLRSDRLEIQAARENLRRTQYDQWLTYATAKYKLLLEYNGSKPYDDNDIFDTRYKSMTFIEEELAAAGYVKLSKEEDLLTEEELVMSYLLTQLEMEESLSNDYDSILTATQKMAQELLQSVADFDVSEKQALQEDGSWFNKHREAIARHEEALYITLEKVRNRLRSTREVKGTVLAHQLNTTSSSQPEAIGDSASSSKVRHDDVEQFVSGIIAQKKGEEKDAKEGNQ